MHESLKTHKTSARVDVLEIISNFRFSFEGFEYRAGQVHRGSTVKRTATLDKYMEAGGISWTGSNRMGVLPFLRDDMMVSPSGKSRSDPARIMRAVGAYPTTVCPADDVTDCLGFLLECSPVPMRCRAAGTRRRVLLRGRTLVANRVNAPAVRAVREQYRLVVRGLYDLVTLSGLAPAIGRRFAQDPTYTHVLWSVPVHTHGSRARRAEDAEEAARQKAQAAEAERCAKLAKRRAKRRRIADDESLSSDSDE